MTTAVKRPWVGAIFLVTLLAYFPAVGAGFIWNDSDYVTRPALRSLGGLWRIWFDVGATEQYYPLLHSAFWVEHLLWGDAPMGYHLVNILLHATSACLFALVLQRLWVERVSDVGLSASVVPNALLGTQSPIQRLGDKPLHLVTLLAALLFALHPVCVESVAWVSEQKNTLSTVFYLLAAIAYLRWREEQPQALRWYLIATVFFIAALLSKSVTATLPAALLVVLWWRQGSLSWRRDAVPLIPWFIVGAASGLFSGWVERTYVGAQGSAFSLSLLERCLLAGRAFWFYLGKLLWPADLIFIYPHWDVSSAEFWQYLFPLGALALAAVLWLIRGRSRGPLAAFLFFAGSLFPTLGFFNLYAFIYSYVADHWQYLPSLGIMAFLAGAWGTIIGKSENRKSGKAGNGLALIRFLPFLVLPAMGVLTWRQCAMYKDIETFYGRTIERNPGCWMAYYNLGLIQLNAGKMREAIRDFEETLRIKPDDADAHNNLALALAGGGLLPEAIQHHEAAVRIEPNSSVFHNNLGDDLSDAGRLDDAIAQYREALRLDPKNPDACYNLGSAFARSGDVGSAIAFFEKALRLKPDYAEARANLGIALANTGRLPEAIAQLETAARLKPGSAAIHSNLAQALQAEGRTAEAQAQLDIAARLQPDPGGPVRP